MTVKELTESIKNEGIAEYVYNRLVGSENEEELNIFFTYFFSAVLDRLTDEDYEGLILEVCQAIEDNAEDI